MARTIHWICCGVVLLALTGCRSPYGCGGGCGYSASVPQGAYMSSPPMGASPYMAAPQSFGSSFNSYPTGGPYYSYPSPTAPSYTTTSPEYTTTNPEFTTTNPEYTTTPSKPLSGTRPVDRLPPDSTDYLETPTTSKVAPSETVDNAPPTTTKPASGGDEADFNGDRSTTPGGTKPPKTPADKIKKLEEAPFDESKVDTPVKRTNMEKGPDGEESEEFEPPSAFKPGKTEVPTGDAADIAADQKKSTAFAYDQKSLTWFRGTAHFDETEQAWSLKFAPEGTKTKFGGVIGLVDHSKLSSIKEGDVILVRGVMEPGTEAAGQPKFKIKTLDRMIPAN